MRRKLFVTAIISLVAALGVAEADEGDRFFQVKVRLISSGTSPFFAPPAAPPGPNCYSFLSDGTWIDPPFPGGPGTWTLDSDGAVTRYTATAESEEIPDVLPPLLLVQEGQITPSFEEGQARLKAFTTIFLGGTDIVLANFMSTGYETDSCD